MRSVIAQVLLTATLLLPPIVVADLSLICPCSVVSEGLTAITITAGISNDGVGTSGKLRVRVSTAPELPIRTIWAGAFGYYPETLNPGFAYPEGTNVRTAFQLPPAGGLDGQNKAIFILDLQEMVGVNWVTQDSVRLSPELVFPKPERGGESVGPAIYLVGTPGLEIDSNGQATVLIPMIVNSSQEEISIDAVRIGHFKSEEFWAQSFLNGANIPVNLTLPAMSSIANVAITGGYTAPTVGYPFSHLLLSTKGSTVVWQTIATRNGEPMPSRNLSANSIDFIADSDSDGVSDYNESIAGTNPADPESRPDTLILDVMAIYTPGVSQLYSGEPEARIIHEMEWGNQALSNSGVDARFRLVDLQQTNYIESIDPQKAISDLNAQVGVFDGIDNARERAGADLLALFIEDDPDDGVCGIGNGSAEKKEGDFGFTPRSAVVSVIAANCRTNALTHEFGHNLGLGHSVRNESDRGTYIWSRGHGVDNQFVTIMAYDTDYNAFGPDVQYFSTPTQQCGPHPCGVDKSDRNLGADAALSIQTTMFQVAALSAPPPDFDADGMIDFEDSDDDNDGVADGGDAFPFDSSESIDTDGDGIGNNLDSDDDGDGVLDQVDAFPLDPTRPGGNQVPDTGNDYLGRAYHMTASESPNLSEVHVINTSASAATFTGTLFHKSGSQLGESNVALHEGLIEPQGRLVLFSTDLERRFNELSWTGPAILDVRSSNPFEVMTKLSRSGRVTNTNCVRTSNAQNVEGTDAPDVSYVRFINDGATAIANIQGTLYDSDGNPIGQQDVQFFESLGPREAVFLSRDSISKVIGATWSGVASLELSATYENLKLMNLNFVNNETFFNFSCYMKAS